MMRGWRIAGALALAGTLHAQAPVQTHRVHMARAGAPDGLALDGPTAEAALGFPLPEGMRLTRGRLVLAVDVTRGVVPGSNLQVFINGTRRFVVAWSADSVPRTVAIPLTPADLQRASVDVRVRSFLGIGRDRCADERLGSAFATILPASFLEYDYDPSTARTAAARWRLLTDTVVVALGSAPLTADRFALAYRLLFELRADAHEVVLVRGDGAATPVATVDGAAPPPATTVLSLVDTASIQSLIGWRRLVAARDRRLPDDPTLAQLGVTDLAREYGYRGTWHLPIDLRVLPPDRVPTAIELDVATAASATSRGVQFFVYWNGALVRSFTAREDGQPQRVHVALPDHLLTIYNEVRVEVQRLRDPSDFCQSPEGLYPAQVMASTTVHTERARGTPRLFTGAALRLPDPFPLYLPSDALTRADLVLPAITALGRALWGNRTPDLHIYAAGEAVSPATPFVAVGELRREIPDRIALVDSERVRVTGPALGRATLPWQPGDVVAQVVRIGGQTGVLVSAPDASSTMPDAPESFGNVDVLIQSPGAAPLRLSSRGVTYESLGGGFRRLQAYAWTTELIATMVGAGVLVLALVAVALVIRRRRRARAAAATPAA